MATPDPLPPISRLSARIALLASGLVLVILTAIGLIADSVLAQRAHAEMRGRSFALLESLSVSCAFDVADGAVERLDDALTELMRKGREQLDVESVALVDRQGTALAHSGSGTFAEAVAALGLDDPTRVTTFAREAAEASQARWIHASRQDDPDALVLSMPVISGLRWGTLIAIFDTSRVESRVDASRTIILAATLAIALTLILALQAGLLTLVVRPLRRLRATVERLESGDFTARAEVVARTEIGQLAHAFNAMAGELEAYTRGLEARVAQRTVEAERRREELEQLNAQLRVLARTDALTGLSNRRHIHDQLDLELGRVRRHNHPLAIAMVDIDHFKAVNDTHGHQAGDAVIQTVAATLKRSVRAHDLVGRHGGEEFIVALLEPVPLEIPAVLDRLREEVAASVTHLPDGQEIRVTMSCGYVVLPEHEGTLDALLALADAALYEAKSQGRNRVVKAKITRNIE